MNSTYVPAEFWEKEENVNDPGDENDFQPGAVIQGSSDELRRRAEEHATEMRRLEAEMKLKMGAVAAEGESICAEADRLVSSERNKDYGHPLDNYTAIAGAARELELDVSIPEHAALFMVVTKIAREVHRPKRDNRVDMAGYAKVVDQIHDERARREAGD